MALPAPTVPKVLPASWLLIHPIPLTCASPTILKSASDAFSTINLAASRFLLFVSLPIVCPSPTIDNHPISD